MKKSEKYVERIAHKDTWMDTQGKTFIQVRIFRETQTILFQCKVYYSFRIMLYYVKFFSLSYTMLCHLCLRNFSPITVVDLDTKI